MRSSFQAGEKAMSTALDNYPSISRTQNPRQHWDSARKRLDYPHPSYTPPETQREKDEIRRGESVGEISKKRLETLYLRGVWVRLIEPNRA